MPDLVSSYKAVLHGLKMSPETRQLLTILLARAPLIAHVILKRLLGFSTPSYYLTLRSELTVAILQTYNRPRADQSITSIQRFLSHDSGVRGKIWVAKTTSPVVEAHDAVALLTTVQGAIDALVEPGTPPLQAPHFVMPNVVPVEAEWTGFRRDATLDSTLPDISEFGKFDALMRDTTRPITILYFHGGAYCLLDPSTHRPATSRLARLTGGRVYSVRYRLAPQNPFPSALVDALVSYLNLLYPADDNDIHHEPVKPAHIVFAGDSAGGNLCLSLLQLLLQLRRSDPKGMATVRWQGQDVPLPLPAGIALNSPWLDITQSSPSWDDQQVLEFDYLPPPSVLRQNQPAACAAWPASPIRASMYCADAALTHPLASVVAARSWQGSPPIWMCTGWEPLATEIRWMARKLQGDGVVGVALEQYEAMPHCFAIVLGNTPEARRCFHGWADFIAKVTNYDYDEEERKFTSDDQMICDMNLKQDYLPDSRFVTIKAKTVREVDININDLTSIGEEEMRQRVVHQAKNLVLGMKDIGAKL